MTASGGSGQRALPREVIAGCALATVVGLFLVALPDSGNRVFSISDTHGPDPIDLVGSAVLGLGWLLLEVAVALRWRLLVATLGRRKIVTGTAAMAVGGVLLAASITADLSWWWWVPAALLACVPQAAAAAALARVRPRATTTVATAAASVRDRAATG